MGESNSRGSSSQSSRRPSPAEEFPSAIWMRIERAKEPTAPQTREALAELCREISLLPDGRLYSLARTVDDPADIEQEITTLIQALAD